MHAEVFDMTRSLPSVSDGRPRIALIAPGPEIPSGQGAQAMTLAAKLRGDGFDVVFLPVDPPFPLSSLRRLRAADVVHIFAAFGRPFLSATAPILLAKRWGKRVVLSYYNGDPVDHAWELGPWTQRVDDIVVPSRSFQRIFAQHGHRARVIPTIVDVLRFQYRKRAPLQPHFLSTRGLDSEHDVENTLLAFALVRTRYAEATLTIAGTGSEANELRRLSESLGNRGIRFLGRIEASAMPRLYEEADIFLNSSLADYQPTAVLEAMASGLPVITTSSGDLPLLVQDGITGMIVPPQNPITMAKAATVLLERPGFAQQIGDRAKERLDPHTWAHVRDAWAGVYAGRLAMSPARMENKAQGTRHAA
jgi:glycosyltransferase involved in cell wall biosynthesis